MKFPFWPRSRRDEHLREEIEGHLQMATKEGIDRGEPREEARHAAHREFGNVNLVREVTSDQWGGRWLENVLQDLRFGARLLGKDPGFTSVAVLTLALGIGANTAIYSLVDALLLRALPVTEPRQLVLINRTGPQAGIENDFPISTFEQFRDRNHSFSGIFARDDSRVSITVNGQPELVWGDFVSGSFFDVLGVGALRGRTFSPVDDQPGKKPVAVITFGLWERRFGRDPSVIGRTIFLGKIPFTVIGVTPRNFHGLGRGIEGLDIILPMILQTQLALKDHDTFEIIGRLKTGVHPEEARAELDVIYQQILRQAAGSSISAERGRQIAASRIELKPGYRGTADPQDSFARELRVLMAIVGIVLLIACVNVANLLLARGAVRQKEIAVRLAIGASRGRLVRQLLTENVLLAALGGMLGLLMANWAVNGLLAVLLNGRDFVPFEPVLDTRIFIFTAGVSLLTGILIGLIPALVANRMEVNPVLKGIVGGARARPIRQGAAKSLVVTQVALSLTLLMGAGLLIRSIHQLYAVDPGYERNKVMMMWAFPALIGYDHSKELNLYRGLLEKMNGIPGVESASVSRFRMIFGQWYRNLWVSGQAANLNEMRRVYCNPVGPRFFETMGIPLLLGREFMPSDSETSSPVAVISESMVRKFFRNENPIGQRIGFDGPQSSSRIQIVGVVKDIKHHPTGDRVPEAVFIPYTQSPAEMLGQMNLVLRAGASPATIIPAIRQQVHSVEPDLPLVDIKTESAEMDESIGDERSLAALLSFFGVLALGLASIGLYGTMSHAVAYRTKELGIRIALGARAEDMLWLILRDTLSLILLGIGIGIPVALAASRLISSMLFGVKATDTVTITFCILLMSGVGLVAGLVPARRAMKVDPIVALRYE
ncbi:MAG: ABC transporter permease [Acidobacteriia bacterium]|nr:ABC transporter permease [Terriglobia bacterium]